MLQTEKNIYQNISLISLHSELTVHYQPIFSAENGQIFGYEALTRPAMNHPEHSDSFSSIVSGMPLLDKSEIAKLLELVKTSLNGNIKNFFIQAKEKGLIFILDMICRENAIREASRQNLDAFLFINICPETLFHPKHEVGITDRLAEEYGFPKEKIVLEITEETAIENYDLLIESISYYKKRGYKIAIDDFGAGYGGPKLFSLLRPDFVKLDRYFIHSVNKDCITKAFIEFTVKICQSLNIKVIAEGIETYEQLLEMKKMEIDFLQGYYLGRPDPKIKKLKH